MKEKLNTIMEVVKDDMAFQFSMPFDPNLRQLGAASDALYEMHLTLKRSIAQRDAKLEEENKKVEEKVEEKK